MKRQVSVGIAALLASVLAAGTAMAHQDPPACEGVNIGQSLVVTPSVGPIRECTPISASTVLSWLGNCLIGTGNLVIGLADPSDPLNPGADQILTTVPVTCLGPATVNNDGCTIGQDSSVSAGPTMFSPRPQDVTAGQITIRARWVGVGHQATVNQPQSNTREVTLPIAPCEPTFCTTVQCVPGQNPGQAECVPTDVSAQVCPDNDFCADTVCNDDIDQCVTTDTSTSQCPDNQFCANVTCSEALDQCVTTDISTSQCPDNLFCANVTCSEALDQCVTTDDSDKCHLDPAIPDVCEPCNEETDQCEVDLTLDPICTPEEIICRTPGFWKTHAGTEKNRSQNITLAVLNSVGGLTVCGVPITNTGVNNGNSVLEAMCVAPRGEQRLQLIRQLTAMGLNCAVSEIGGDCGGNVALGDASP